MHTSIRCRSILLVITLACLSGALARGRAQTPPQDTGASGAWQKLLKLRTTASAMHTTAHPDDEHAGVLAMLSRGQGARVSLLTLTRGESGDNAIGPELFDGARADPNRGTARRGPVLRRRSSVLRNGRRLRVLQTSRRGAGEVGQTKRPSRRRRHHPHRAAVRAHREVPGKRAGRPREPLGGGAGHAGSVHAGGGRQGVPGADCRGTAAVAAVEAVHGRRARERRLDDPRRCRRVRPGARRFVSVVRAPGPELPAVAERRALQPAARAVGVVLQTSSVAG